MIAFYFFTRFGLMIALYFFTRIWFGDCTLFFHTYLVWWLHFIFSHVFGLVIALYFFTRIWFGDCTLFFHTYLIWWLHFFIWRVLVYLLPKTLKLFYFPIFWLWAYRTGWRLCHMRKVHSTLQEPGWLSSRKW